MYVGDLTQTINGTVKTKKIALSSADGTGENDTGWDLPAKAAIFNMVIDVTTAESTGTTKTIKVGLLTGETGEDPDGFFNGVDVSATGLAGPGFAMTTGSNETYLTGSTAGVLFARFAVGADTDGHTGFYARVNYLTDTVAAKSISWTPGSTDWAEFRGDLYIIYVETA